MRTRLAFIAGLGVFVFGGCRPDDVLKEATAKSADIMAAEAIVEYVTAGGSPSARIMLGTWNVIAEANTEWSARLADAMRLVAEEDYRNSPDVSFLLRIIDAGSYPDSSEWDGYVKIMALGRHDGCCALVYVDFRHDGDNWEVRDWRLMTGTVGIGHPLTSDGESSMDLVFEESKAEERPFIPRDAK